MSSRAATNDSEWVDRVQEQFEIWDTTGGGVITEEQLKGMLQRLRPDFTGTELDIILSAVDRDASGCVDYKVFVEWAFSNSAPASRAGGRRSAQAAAGAGIAAASAGGGGAETFTTAALPAALCGGGATAAGLGSGRSPVSRGGGASSPLVGSRGGTPLASRGGGTPYWRRAGLDLSPCKEMEPVDVSSPDNNFVGLGTATGGSSSSRSGTVLRSINSPQSLSHSARGPQSGASSQRGSRAGALLPLESPLRVTRPVPIRAVSEQGARLAGGASESGGGRSSAPTPVRSGELRRAMERLHQRVSTGEVVMSDRLLQRLTTETARSCSSASSSARRPRSGDGDGRGNEFTTVTENEAQVVGNYMEHREAADLVPFGMDVAAAPQTEHGTCGICFDEDVEVVSLCGSAFCADRFCLPCSRRAAETMVDGALYAMPWLRCPSCSSRVATKVWRNWVDEDVFQKYLGNGEALLNFRCPSCHETGSLFRKAEGTGAADQGSGTESLTSEGAGKAGGVIESLTEPAGTRLRSAWAKYALAEQSAEGFMSELVELFKEQRPEVPTLPLGSAEPPQERGHGAAAAGDRAMDLDGAMPEGAPPAALRAAMKPASLPMLISDSERRCSLQLAFLRRFPKIQTPCCNAPMCFKCKVGGWHEGETCESRQRQEMQKDVQFCPGCGVPTVKSEGCDHIVCVCGESWTWAPNPVWSAVRAARVDVLEEMLEDGFDVDFMDEETGETLLHVAAEDSHLEIVSLLLRRGADVGRVDAGSATVLAAAVRRPFRQHAPAVLRGLLDHAADVNASISPDGGFVLTEVLRTLAYGRAGEEGEAAEHDEAADRARGVELVQVLLAARARVDVRDEDLDGSTPLLEAVRCGFDEIAALLVAASAETAETAVLARNDTTRPRTGLLPPMQPLQATEDEEDPEEAGGIERSASLSHLEPSWGLWLSPIEAADRSGNTPLYLAAANRHINIAKELLAAGASTDTRGPGGTPPLHVTITNGDPAMFELLLNAKADANLAADDGHNALLAGIKAMCRDGHHEWQDSNDTSSRPVCLRMVIALVPKTRDLDAAGLDGQTALGAAAANGFMSLVAALLHQRASPDQPAKGGVQPLGWAAQCGQVPAVRILLEHRADPCGRDAAGQAPLHRLAGNWRWQDFEPRRSEDEWLSRRGRRHLGRAEAVGVLLDARADPDCLDAAGRPVLLLAAEPPPAQAKHGSTWPQPRNGVMALPAMVPSAEQVAVLRALLEGRSNVDVTSSEGLTPLLAAVRVSSEIISAQLLAFQADANNVEPTSGARPLKLALLKASTTLVKDLIGSSAAVDAVDNNGLPAVLAWVESFAMACTATHGTWAMRSPAFQQMLEDVASAVDSAGLSLQDVPEGRPPPLHAAWSRLPSLGRGSAVHMLLHARADPNIRHVHGRTLLHTICSEIGSGGPSADSEDTLRLLLRMRGDALGCADDGSTPLEYVVAAGAAGRSACRVLLDSLPEGCLIGPKWGQLLFRELQVGDEQLLNALVVRAGVAHLNDFGQGPLEVLISYALFRDVPPRGENAGAVEPKAEAIAGLAGPRLDPLVQVRCAEMLQSYGATLPVPLNIWSPCWDVDQAGQALRCLGRLQELGPQIMLECVEGGPESKAPALGAVLAATCALAGVDADVGCRKCGDDATFQCTYGFTEGCNSDPCRTTTPSAGITVPSPRANTAAQGPDAWWSHYRPAAKRLVGSDGTQACCLLTHALWDSVLGELSATAAADVARYFEDKSLSGPEALQAAGPAAVELGAWVKAAHEIRCSHRPVASSLWDICRRVECSFPDNPDLRRRWLRLVLTAVADPDAEDGAAGRVAHLALGLRELGVSDALLPLLQRGADASRCNKDGATLLELLRARASSVLAGFASGQEEGEEAHAGDAAGDAAGTAEEDLAGRGLELAVAVADVERCSLHQHLLDEVAAQTLATEILEVQLREAASNVELTRSELNAELAKVVPAVEAAAEALDSLTMRDLQESRMMARPPHGLALALAAVCTALGVERSLRVPSGDGPSAPAPAAAGGGDGGDGGAPAAEPDPWDFEACMEFWPAARKLLAGAGLVHQMRSFDRDSLTSTAVEQLRPLESHPLFEPLVVRRMSVTAEAMVLWTRSLLAYYDLVQALTPKRERFREMMSEIEAKERHLANSRQRLLRLRQESEESSKATATASQASKSCAALRAALVRSGGAA